MFDAMPQISRCWRLLENTLQNIQRFSIARIANGMNCNLEAALHRFRHEFLIETIAFAADAAPQHVHARRRSRRRLSRRRRQPVRLPRESAASGHAQRRDELHRGEEREPHHSRYPYTTHAEEWTTCRLVFVEVQLGPTFGGPQSWSSELVLSSCPQLRSSAPVLYLVLFHLPPSVSLTSTHHHRPPLHQAL